MGKNLDVMSHEELIELNKNLHEVFEMLNAFRNVVSSARILSKSKVSGDFIDTKSFYECVTAADKALGIIIDPTML